MPENNSSQMGGVVAAFAVGALVGAAVALLYAPRSGKDTREIVTAKGRELKAKVNDALDEVPAFLDGKRAEVAAAIESGREAIREKVDKHLRVD
jgi:gas vesicle protein